MLHLNLGSDFTWTDIICVFVASLDVNDFPHMSQMKFRSDSCLRLWFRRYLDATKVLSHISHLKWINRNVINLALHGMFAGTRTCIITWNDSDLSEPQCVPSQQAMSSFWCCNIWCNRVPYCELVCSGDVHDIPRQILPRINHTTCRTIRAWIWYIDSLSNRDWISPLHDVSNVSPAKICIRILVCKYRKPNMIPQFYRIFLSYAFPCVIWV